MKKLSELEKQGYEELDASLEISLAEYGLAWKKEDNEIEFIYGTNTNNKDNFNRFDWAWLPADTDPKKEYDWVDFEAVASFSGDSTPENFLALPLTDIVFTLLLYYGPENVFGSSYFEGIKIDFEN